MMCVFVFHFRRDFRPTSMEKGHEKVRLRIYKFYAWGVPLIITGIAAILDNLPKSLHEAVLRPRFGEKKCWFAGKYHSIDTVLHVYLVYSVFLRSLIRSLHVSFVCFAFQSTQVRNYFHRIWLHLFDWISLFTLLLVQVIWKFWPISMDRSAYCCALICWCLRLRRTNWLLAFGNVTMLNQQQNGKQKCSAVTYYISICVKFAFNRSPSRCRRRDCSSNTFSHTICRFDGVTWLLFLRAHKYREDNLGH